MDVLEHEDRRAPVAMRTEPVREGGVQLAAERLRLERLDRAGAVVAQESREVRIGRGARIAAQELRIGPVCEPGAVRQASRREPRDAGVDGAVAGGLDEVRLAGAGLARHGHDGAVARACDCH